MTADTLSDQAAIRAALFGTSVMFAPIRHHSPACAFAVRQMIRAHRPEVVLIEAPSDLAHHVPLLLAEDARFPLAVVALGPRGEGGRRPSMFLPFSDHAPEMVAIREAAALGADVVFIDLPVNARGMALADHPVPVADESPFDSADMVAALCRKTGLRDGYELWDHLFEPRLGEADWQGLLADIYAYCDALRASTGEARIATDGTLPREDAMRAALAGIGARRAVVVTGGFHTPALLDPAQWRKSVPEKVAPSESWLIAYGEEALDALSGYGAGLRFPGWYDGLWQRATAADGPPDCATAAQDTLFAFAAAEALAGQRISVPEQVETLYLAQALARLRGRQAVLLSDLRDAIRTALLKGEAAASDRRTDAFARHLAGTRLGRAPRAAGLPPIVQDARDQASALRFDLSDSIRRSRKLDIRRNPAHARASAFCHRMTLLDVPFARLLVGPDFVTGARAGLLFEEWDTGWSPGADARLIELSPLGSTVTEAAVALLVEQQAALVAAGRSNDLDALLVLVLKALRAGLAEGALGLLPALDQALAQSSDLPALARVIDRLQGLSQPGDPLHDPDAPDLLARARTAFDRFLALCPDMTAATAEEMAGQITALGVVAAALRGEGAARFDGARFDAAMAALSDDSATPPMLRGAVLGLLTRAGLSDPALLAQALGGGLVAVGHTPEARLAVLDGLLRSAPMLLWLHPPILAATESALAALSDDGFLDMLPDLRRSLTALNPHETARLADELSGLLGLDAAGLTLASPFSEAEVARALALEAALRTELVTDGLSHWSTA